MDKKRTALIIGFIAATALIGWGLYYVFFRTAPIAPPAAPTGGVLPAGGVLPSAGPGAPPGKAGQGAVPSAVQPLPSAAPIAQGGITQTTEITSNPVLSPHMSGSNIAYYDQTQGKFFRVDQNGNQTALSNQTFFNVQKVTWNNQTDKAILEYPDGSKIFYDFATQKQATLPKHWQDFAFDPSGTKIAAKSIGLEPENRWLVVANPDGSGAQTAIPLGSNDDKVRVSWSPNNQIVGFSATGDARGFDSQEIIPLGLHNENYKGIVVPGLDFNPLWSTQGDKLLFSAYNNDSSFKPELWVVNAEGDAIGTGRAPIELNTWANKCTFADNATAYCAVPQSLPEGAGFEPDIANGTPDTLYKIDLNTGIKTPVAVPDQNFTISAVTVSPAKDTLYFTDAATGHLHKIRLK